MAEFPLVRLDMPAIIILGGSQKRSYEKWLKRGKEMTKWASKAVRQQREEIIVRKKQEGWRVKDIANYIGIKSGSVSSVLKRYTRREMN